MLGQQFVCIRVCCNCVCLEKYEEMKGYVKDTEKQRDQVGVA